MCDDDDDDDEDDEDDEDDDASESLPGDAQDKCSKESLASPDSRVSLARLFAIAARKSFARFAGAFCLEGAWSAVIGQSVLT